MPTEAVSVRAIFDRAVEISTEAERAAYLDKRVPISPRSARKSRPSSKHTPKPAASSNPRPLA